MLEAGDVFVLRVELEEIVPTVWRRLAVPSSATFGFLHLVLQAAFSWENAHLYEFGVGNEKIAPVDPDEPQSQVKDSRCLEGERFAPPEDSGGAAGIGEILTTDVT